MPSALSRVPADPVFRAVAVSVLQRAVSELAAIPPIVTAGAGTRQARQQPGADR
jgi:hypothetical protein